MIKSHPVRDRIIAEMHLRRLPALEAPVSILQALYLVPPELRDEDEKAMLAVPDGRHTMLLDRPRHAEGISATGCHFLWERHSEACTATVVIPHSESRRQVVENDRTALAWLGGSRGLALRAVRILVVQDEEEAAARIPQLELDRDDLVSCRIGATRIWSDFRIHEEEMGVLLVAAGETLPSDLGRLIQGFQELGNYRNLALLGLPVAEERASEIAKLEGDLASITARMTTGNADQPLLDELCALAARTAAINAATGFRMSATAAYAQIADERLRALDAQPIAGYQSIGHFTERRLLPAVRTCASYAARLEQMALRIERATSLLRTRVDVVVQTQNTSLLASMDRNAERQLRLQHLVEGLSVVAVSYYAIALIDHLIGGFVPIFGRTRDEASAVLVIPVFCIVWLLLRSRARTAARSPSTVDQTFGYPGHDTDAESSATTAQSKDATH